MVKTPRHSLLLWAWVLHLVLGPFYIFKSGLPQPADYLMAVLIVFVASGIFIRLPRAPDLYLAIGAFLLIVWGTNLFWFNLYFDEFFVMSSLFYIFNAGILLCVVVLFSMGQPERVCRFTAYGILLAIVVELAIMVTVPNFQGIRGVGTFNNPNQLGYWSIISATCWLVIRGERRLDLFDVGVLTAIGYLTSLSLSKAAMVSFMMLVVFALVAHGLRGRWATTVVGVLVLCLPILIIDPSVLGNRISAFFSDGSAALVVDRFDSVGQQQDDSLAGRGYDRIWLYPGHLLFGAGEGEFGRFDLSALRGIELHSSWGTLLFSYGLVGLLAFSTILWVVFRRAPMRYWFYFLPLALYGLTHQGLRFSLMWVFFGLVYGVSRYVAVAALPGARLAGEGAGVMVAEEASDASYSDVPGERRVVQRTTGGSR